MNPRLRAFFAPQLTSEGIFPFERLPPKATVDEKADSPVSPIEVAKPSQPDVCSISEAPLKPGSSQTKDDLEVTVSVAKSVTPNFVSNAPVGPFVSLKHDFTYQPQLSSKKILFKRPLVEAPAPKPKRERKDPLPKLLEFMEFESILSEPIRKQFASKLGLEDLIQRSTVPNAELLQWLWPMKEHIVAQWDNMENLPRAQKLDALRKVKKAVQLKMKVEKADRVCQYLMADKKKKNLPRPPELDLTEDEKRAYLDEIYKTLVRKPSQHQKQLFLNWARTVVADFELQEAVSVSPDGNVEVVSIQEDVVLKLLPSGATKISDQQLFVNKFSDEKTSAAQLPPDDPGGGSARGSVDDPPGFLQNQPVRPPPVKISRALRKRRRSKR
jgi:hypothetical protein